MLVEVIQPSPARRLNGLASWHKLDGGAGVQLRCPDGDHITFQDHSDAVLEALAALSQGHAVVGEIGQAVEELLEERKLLVPVRDGGEDWMLDGLEYVLELAGGTASSSALDRARSVPITIAGDGWLADRVRSAGAIAGLSFAAVPDEAQICIVVADQLQMDAFSAANRQALQKGQMIAFFWRDSSKLCMGPVVIPGESACFECYRSRLRANTDFVAEFDARAAAAPQTHASGPSALFGGVVEGFVARFLVLIAAGAWDMVNPGTVYSLEGISLQTGRQPILRVSRCPACGAAQHAPRAVRALV